MLNKTEQRRRVTAMIQRLQDAAFYGTCTIRFRDGDIYTSFLEQSVPIEHMTEKCQIEVLHGEKPKS